MKVIEVSIYNDSGLDLPQYETEGASGMDIRSKIDIEVGAQETKLIPTGLYVAIPDGWEIQVRPRSGLSLKTAFRVANAPGTVDADYRGELCVIAWNTSNIPFFCKKGERISQIVLQEVPKIKWIPVASKDDLPGTDRGIKGFGSTGV